MSLLTVENWAHVRPLDTVYSTPQGRFVVIGQLPDGLRVALVEKRDGVWMKRRNPLFVLDPVVILAANVLRRFCLGRALA